MREYILESFFAETCKIKKYVQNIFKIYQTYDIPISVNSLITWYQTYVRHMLKFFKKICLSSVKHIMKI